MQLRDIRDYFAFVVLVYGPAWCHDPYKSYGRWVLSTAGNWVYRAERLEDEREQLLPSKGRSPGS